MARIVFSRMELAGSLGDLGTFLPIAFGLSLINGLSLEAIFFSAGLFYILAGAWFRVPVAIQPMKVIGAYALVTAASPPEIFAAELLMGLILIVLALTGLMNQLVRYIPRPVVRGVQAATGAVLAAGGIRFITGSGSLQQAVGRAEPFLPGLSTLPWLPVVLGILFALATLFLLDNKRFPAALVAVVGGMAVGLPFADSGSLSAMTPSLYVPDLLPTGWPAMADLAVAMMVMVLPQLPMTVGNAVIATNDLTHEYYPETGSRTSPKFLCLSMGLANLAGFFLGAMPMCHGAGGLAAHYRFGARTAGSNFIIGGLLLVLAVVLGSGAVVLATLIPLSVLGVLLFFSGITLMLAITDSTDRASLAVIFAMIGITLGTNLGVAFVAGFILHFLMRRFKLSL